MYSKYSDPKMPAEEAILMGLLLARKMETGEISEYWFFFGLKKLAQDYPERFRRIYEDYREKGLPASGLLKDILSRLGLAGTKTNFWHWLESLLGGSREQTDSRAAEKKIVGGNIDILT